MNIHYPAEGRNYLMDAAINGAQQIADWYVVLFEGDYTPQDDDTAANINARATEITAYAENTRPKLVTSAAVGGVLDNQGSIAQFTMTAAKTVRAFGIVSSAGKGTVTGKLLGLQRLPSPRSYSPGDVVKVPVSLSLANVI